MIVKQTVTLADGTVKESEFVMEMEKGRTDVCWTLSPTNDEPLAIRIVESGWFDHGEPMYHVLSEWGAYEETSYSHLSLSQLLERHPEFKNIYNSAFQDVAVEGETVKAISNDRELGAFVRQSSSKLVTP